MIIIVITSIYMAIGSTPVNNTATLESSSVEEQERNY